jgi:hypothetical protein
VHVGLHRLETVTNTGTMGYDTIDYGYNAAGSLRTKGDPEYPEHPYTLLYEGGPAGAGPHAVTRVTQ